MGAVLTFFIYFLLVSVVLVASVLLAKILVKALSHVLYIVPEYLWHNFTVALFAAFVIGGIVLLIMFA